MNKPIIQSASDIINQPGIDDTSAIKMVASAIYPRAVKAIMDYRENKDKIKDTKDHTPIVTGDEIREFMKRPLVDRPTPETKETTPITKETTQKTTDDGFER